MSICLDYATRLGAFEDKEGSLQWPQSGIMIVPTADRGRDAYTPDPATPKGGLSMQPQLTTSPLFGDPRLPTRFWNKVTIAPSGCWLWTSTKVAKGYGRFALREQGRRRAVYAHRYAYETLIGPIPAGLQSDHLCRVRACVNPSHIEPVTGSINCLRGNPWGRGRTHCPQGHPYDETNTYITPQGYRHCRECNYVRQKRVTLALSPEQRDQRTRYQREWSRAHAQERNRSRRERCRGVA